MHLKYEFVMPKSDFVTFLAASFFQKLHRMIMSKTLQQLPTK